MAREHTLDGAAAGYMRFLSTRYGWGTTPPLRAEPLWAIESQEPSTEYRVPSTGEPPRGYPTTNKEQGTTTDNGQRTTDNGQFSILNSQFAEALAGLGATEDDRPLIEDVARAMAELGMTG